jgi:hypothetical protein
MRRREFITLIGGAACGRAVAAPLGLAFAQSNERVRIGYLWIGPEGSDGQTLSGVRQGLADVGLVEGRKGVRQLLRITSIIKGHTNIICGCEPLGNLPLKLGIGILWVPQDRSALRFWSNLLDDLKTFSGGLGGTRNKSSEVPVSVAPSCLRGQPRQGLQLRLQ